MTAHKGATWRGIGVVRHGAWAACLAGLLLLAPLSAHAGPPEIPGSIAVNPSNPDVVVVRYDYVGGGMLFSGDAGASWKLACNGGLNPEINKETIALVAAPSGEVFTGEFGGLWRVAPGGCGATMEETFTDQWVSDLYMDPSDPNTIYAITSSGGEENGVFVYDATADTWTPKGSRERLLISRIRATSTADGVRLYESISDGETMVMDEETGNVRYYPNYFIRHSDDEGETWNTFPGFEMTDGNVRLEAIDPTDPDRIVISESFGKEDPRADRVWINTAAGMPEASEMLSEVGYFGGAAFGPDGELYFSDAEGALYVLDAGAATPRVLADAVRARCLAYDAGGDRLLACQLFTVVEVGDAGALTPVLDFREVQDWVKCDADMDMPGMCQDQTGVTGWCGPSHYPDAGVCAAYCYPGRGFDSDADAFAASPEECVPGEPVDPGSGSGDGDGDAVGDPMTQPDTTPDITGDGDGSAAPMGGAGGSDLGGGDASGGVAGGGDGPVDPPAPPGESDSGGCHVGRAGAVSPYSAPFVWTALLGVVTWYRRRRD